MLAYLIYRTELLYKLTLLPENNTRFYRKIAYNVV